MSLRCNKLPSPYPPFRAFLPPLPIRYFLFQKRVEFTVVVVADDVTKFVYDDLYDAGTWSFDKIGIEDDYAVRSATSPAGGHLAVHGCGVEIMSSFDLASVDHATVMLLI